MRSVLALGLACTLFTIGCGDGSPTSPSTMATSTPGTPSATAGATVTGSVTNASAPNSLPTVSRAYGVGLMVQVVGTSISVAVGPNGEFTLQGVPEGDVRLRFTGDGCDATLTLSGLKSGELVQIKVTVRGSTATLDDDSRHDQQVELNGNVSELTKSGSAFSFRIGSQVVNGDATTEFFGDGNRSESVENLANGMRVEVKGEMRNGQVFALRIHINPNSSPDPNEPVEVEAEGQIVAKSGAGANLVLTVRPASGSDITVYTSAGTTVQRGSQSLTLDALAVGQAIEAEGTAHAGGGIDAKKISIEDSPQTDPGEMEIEGALSGLTKSCPSATFAVKSVSVFTTAATTWSGGLSCATLKDGDSVKVKGTKQSDGRLLALQIKK